MDTNQNSPEEQLHLKVLEKYINLFLFGSVITPDFPPENKLAIEEHLLKMLESAELVDEAESDIIIESFLQKFYTALKEQLNDNDLVNLMNCYGNSNFRSHMKISSMLKTNKVSTWGDDTRILNDLLWNLESFPKEILSYMYLQFSDILMHINLETKVISKKEYRNMIKKYKIDCSYEDILKKLNVEKN